MATFPLNDLVLGAASVADDLGFVALADVALACEGIEALVIGGHMVQLHVYRWGLGAELYRQTQDADLGMGRLAAKDPGVTDRLRDPGYRRTAGNVFERDVGDISVAAPEGRPHCAVVEVLVPTYTSRARHSLWLGHHLTTAEVPGLAEALKRPAVTCQLRLTRLNNQVLETTVSLPDEVSALVLKVLVRGERLEDRDAVNIWRCTEVLMTAGLDLSSLSGKTGNSVRGYLRSSVADRNGQFIQSIVRYRGLSAAAGDALHTRMRATVARLTGADRA
ncbi:MAG: hypothetical protein ACLQVK_11725 [Acidimicrobiales bacterium]